MLLGYGCEEHNEIAHDSTVLERDDRWKYIGAPPTPVKRTRNMRAAAARKVRS